jgi:site-specific DNA-methyltransferase (cytosine-N4-specific)
MTDTSLSESDRSAHPTLIGQRDATIPLQVEENEQKNHCASDPIEILPSMTGNSVMKTVGSNITHISQIIQSSVILCGDSQSVLRTLPNDFFSCCITSPPYWDTRYSGFADKLGCEDDYREYIGNLVRVFREVRRTLKPSGTLWLVIGDTYASDDPRWWAMCKGKPEKEQTSPRSLPTGFKPKDLMGIPWRLAMELQNDGWYLRSDIVWSIPNHRHEPVSDRPARAHDYVFLFTKSEQYEYHGQDGETKTRRTVWEIPTVFDLSISYGVFPETLVERCMRAGSLRNEAVLDPFFGSGTVGIVAKRLVRRYVGIELNPEYVALAERRIKEKS